MGNFIKFLYNANLKLAKVFSVKLINSDSLKNENPDCKIKIPNNPKAILFALLRSLLATQSTNNPKNFGNANAVILVRSKKNKPT